MIPEPPARPEDDPGLAGRVAIVTGGGAAGDGIGNGRATCILLARSGTRVLVVDRDEGLAKRTAEMIAVESGIGFLVLHAGNIMATTKLMVGIVLLSLLGVLSHWGLGRLERLALPWRSG